MPAQLIRTWTAPCWLDHLRRYLAVLAEFTLAALESLGVDVPERDRRPRLQRPLRHRVADAARAAGNHDNAAFQIDPVHLLSPAFARYVVPLI